MDLSTCLNPSSDFGPKMDRLNKRLNPSPGTLDDDHREYEDKPLKTKIGVATFSIRNKLVKHVRSSREDKVFKCDLCDKEFKRESQLSEHHSEHTLDFDVSGVVVHPSIQHQLGGHDDVSGVVVDPSIEHQLGEHESAQTEETPIQNHSHDAESKESGQHVEEVSQDTLDEEIKASISKVLGEGHAGLHSQEMSLQSNLLSKDFTRNHKNQSENTSVEKDLTSSIEDAKFPSEDTIDEEEESLLSFQNRIRSQLYEHATAEMQIIGKSYQCDICFKHFKQKGHFIAHQRVHTGEKPFKCDECDKSFTKKYNLTVHKQSKHVGYKRFTCSQCDKTFAQKCQLVSHENMHSGVKPFVCYVCFKSFPRKYNLTIHETTHSAEKPHKCEKCGKGFALKSHLNLHLRRKHPDPAELNSEKIGENSESKVTVGVTGDKQ